jgi:ribosomal protein L7/L12
MKVQRTITLTLALALVALGAVACGGGNSTPTKAFQTFYNGIKNKDVKSLKAVMPKEMLDAGEKRAKEQNKTLDDMLKEQLDKGEMPKISDKMPETRNETIAGDGKTATLEVKDPESDKWGSVTFVKEDDGWKIKSLH